ncbi:hypothetical protein JJB52_08525 [Clostridium perfringens]|uniref:hypothetical protein n=1 Tax=Clostridium perfringens TaxID=1502 RepID=UPI001ABAF8C7|nr:hypothetical protein [Clostridium perfringens]MBO3344309.1 hypothetical protein [Clostridium perfringens]MBO3346994.1 hypothetical protein [Clostridium perfringens]MBO3350050.1 hypothetical protein [Clostridium perfringens]MBO3370782.1 hypothetical protein [Clostridium perfringens]
MAYELCKFQIQSGNYNKEEMKGNLVVFKMIGELTADQVLELNNMMNTEKIENSKE